MEIKTPHKVVIASGCEAISMRVRLRLPRHNTPRNDRKRRFGIKEIM